MTEFNEILDDPDKIEKRLKHGKPFLCMYLNPGLKEESIWNLAQGGYIVKIWHKGVVRRAVLCRCYKNKQPRDPEHDKGEGVIFEKLLRESELYLLLRETVPDAVLIDFIKIYEVVNITHEGKDRFALMCDMYTQNKNAVLKPGIGWQDWNWRTN